MALVAGGREHGRAGECPGTTRSATPGGRALTSTMSRELATRIRAAAGLPAHAAGAEAAGQLLPQRPAGLHEERLVDRLVRHAHLRFVGILDREPRGDLLRRP